MQILHTLYTIPTITKTSKILYSMTLELSFSVSRSEMEFAWLRLLAFLILTGVDTGVAVYYRYTDVDTNVSYVAHLAGAATGFLLGIVVLKNFKVTTWERVVWWISLLLFLGLFLAAIIWNAVLIGL